MDLPSPSVPLPEGEGREDKLALLSKAAGEREDKLALIQGVGGEGRQTALFPGRPAREDQLLFSRRAGEDDKLALIQGGRGEGRQAALFPARPARETTSCSSPDGGGEMTSWHFSQAPGERDDEPLSPSGRGAGSEGKLARMLHSRGAALAMHRAALLFMRCA
jgi:hypothetical protein